MRRLLQLLPSHHRHDAIGGEALAIERIMHEAGWQVQTYAEFIDAELEGKTKPIGELEEPRPGTVALYHLAVVSDVAEHFAALACPRAAIYHNVTPPDFFRPWDAGIAGVVEASLAQVRALAGKVDLALGDSEYNRLDLERFGYPVTRVLPILFDRDHYKVEPDAEMLRRLEGRRVVLMVGREVPNKAPDDFIRAAAAYAELADAPPALFLFAGKRNALPAYAEEIEKLRMESGLGEDRLLFTGELTQAELMAAYRSADVFLCLSRHEGFYVPILESWLFGVPIIALASTAVPETLGDAGLLISNPDPRFVAEQVRLLLTDDVIRRELIERGRFRLERFSMRKWGLVLRNLLEQLCA